jgi:hypothetical protein
MPGVTLDVYNFGSTSFHLSAGKKHSIMFIPNKFSDRFDVEYKIHFAIFVKTKNKNSN